MEPHRQSSNAPSKPLSLQALHSFDGIRIAESRGVSKLVKRLAVLGLSILTVATVAMGFVSFARKVDSFSAPGFSSRRQGGALAVASVDPGSAAARAGLV